MSAGLSPHDRSSRVSDAVLALQRACNDFNTTINESISSESSFVVNSKHMLVDSDTCQEPLAKRSRTTPERHTTSRCSTAELQEKLTRCQMRVLALEAEKDVRIPLLTQEALEKETQILALRRELEKVRSAKVIAEERFAAKTEELERASVDALASSESLEAQLKAVLNDLHELEKRRDVDVRDLKDNLRCESEKRILAESLAFERGRSLVKMTSVKDETLEKLRVVEKELDCEREAANVLRDQLSRLKEELLEAKKLYKEAIWASDVIEKGSALEEKMKILGDWESELSRLRKENQKLHEDRLNVSVITERLRILENVKNSAIKARERCAQLECDLEVAQSISAQWERCLVEADSSLNSPQEVLRQIRKLQNAEICLLDENNKLKTELALLKNREQINVEEESRSVRRLRRLLKLVTQERDSYRAVLDSYESEVNIQPTSGLSRRVAQLEAMLSEYRVLTAQLEADAAAAAAVTDRSSAETAVSTLADGALTRDSKDVQVQTDTLGSASRETATTHLRLLHFRENPLDMAHAERKAYFKSLEAENERLVATIKVFEEKGSSNSISDNSFANLIRDDPRKLRGEIAAAKKREERILAAFKKTSREFRQAVYCLTGYRIDMTSNRCVLRHVYAESEEDQLEFEIGERGFLHLLTNDYSLKLSNLVSEYLQKMDSIPAFLGSLTLQLFNAQTLMMQPTEQPSMFAVE